MFTNDCDGASSSSNTYSSSDATFNTVTDAQPSMFTGTSYYAILTSKGMDLGNGGLTMPTQSNAHYSDDNDLFSDTYNNDGEVAGDKLVATGIRVIDYSLY